MCLYSPFNSVAAISGKNVFYSTDWRFNEFPNAPTHALYVTCVELLGLPVAPSLVANNLIDVIVSGYAIIPQKDIHSYINAVGIVLAALPEPYWSGIYDRLQDMLNTPNMLNWTYRFNAFELFNFKTVREAMLEKTYAVVLAVAHSVFHHMGAFKLAAMTRYLKEKLKPCVRTEQQLLYLCHVFVVRHMAPICVWIHLMKKARVENMNITRPLPIALKNHYE